MKVMLLRFFYLTSVLLYFDSLAVENIEYEIDYRNCELRNFSDGTQARSLSTYLRVRGSTASEYAESTGEIHSVIPGLSCLRTARATIGGYSAEAQAGSSQLLGRELGLASIASLTLNDGPFAAYFLGSASAPSAAHFQISEPTLICLQMEALTRFSANYIPHTYTGSYAKLARRSTIGGDWESMYHIGPAQASSYQLVFMRDIVLIEPGVYRLELSAQAYHNNPVLPWEEFIDELRQREVTTIAAAALSTAYWLCPHYPSLTGG